MPCTGYTRQAGSHKSRHIPVWFFIPKQKVFKIGLDTDCFFFSVFLICLRAQERERESESILLVVFSCLVFVITHISK